MSRCPNCGLPLADRARFCEECGFDLTGAALPPTLPATVAAPSPETILISSAARQHRTQGSALSAGEGSGWVAEIWVDPSWYQGQQTTHQLPSSGRPLLVPVDRTALIGRRSSTRGVQPDIDCSADPGVSRRHAQLIADGGRWFVQDLGSSNGSFVAVPGGGLPEIPLERGGRCEFVEGASLYLGAWTRIDLRRTDPQGQDD